MSIKYVAFDVETPNCMNNRISSIGITTIDEFGRYETKETLVNPECGFDAKNISLTGITPESVESAPTFPEVWERIETLFTEATVVAHNAQFDLCVLQKVLAAYGLPAFTVEYLCTLKMAKAFIPSLDNHRLPALCTYFKIPLDHHNAGSDSQACALILLEMLSRGANVEHYLSQFDLAADVCSDERTHNRHQILSKDTLALNEMNTILRAISCDGVLTNGEINYLIDWMNENISLKGNFPYDRIYNKLVEVLEDGVITKQEHDELVRLFQTATNPVETATCSCGCINPEGKNICLSGEFDFGSKDAVSSILTAKGAIMQNGVTKKTDILVVGGQGSSAWSSGNYGSKIKKALELQAKGIAIQIIREADFFDGIEA